MLLSKLLELLTKIAPLFICFPLVFLPLWGGHVNWLGVIRGCSAAQEGTLRVRTKQHIQKGDTIACRSLTLHKMESKSDSYWTCEQGTF